MGDHDKALRTLVIKLGDFSSAESYCDQMSEGRGSKFNQNLLHNLLKIYMDPTLE